MRSRVKILLALGWLGLGAILTVIMPVQAESMTTIDSSVRLSHFLTNRLEALNGSSNSPLGELKPEIYLPGLVWQVPEEAVEQARFKSHLLSSVKAESLRPQISPEVALGLYQFIESLPVTGRVVVSRTDSRWLEVNSLHDPVLQSGQHILIPDRPSTVTVIKPNGQICQVTHSVQAFAIDYVKTCDSSGAPQSAWIVQPDGLVQYRGVALWNEVKQDPPAPGAWIVIADLATPWSNTILQQLARFLATQGSAKDHDAAHILPLAARPNNPFTGNVAQPRNLQSAGKIFQTPTARMGSAGEASMTLNHVYPYTDLIATLQPLNWFELSFGYGDFANALYDPTIAGNQSYKDKTMDVKFKVFEEGAYFPQIAVGLKDFVGTGLKAGEYAVVSKRTGNLDWSLGLGWGRLGTSGNVKNPFSVLSSSFNKRQTPDAATGGQFNTGTWFTGPTALFGGVQYQTPWEPLMLKLEYEGNNYQQEPHGKNLKQASPVNLGLTYRWLPALDLSMSWERATTLGLGANFHGDLSKFGNPKLGDPQPEKVSPIYPTEEPDWDKLGVLLEEKTLWRVLRIQRVEGEVIVQFEHADAQYWNSYLDRIASVLHRYVPGRNVKVFRIQSADYGLNMHEYLIDRQAWVEAKTGYIPLHRRQSTVVERQVPKMPESPPPTSLVDNLPKKFDGKMGLSFSDMLGGPDGFFLYQLGVSGTANWYFQPQTWWTGELDYRMLDNFNKFKFDAPSGLPRVRTDVRKYLVTSRLTMPTFQMTHVGKVNQENFYSVYGGMLESMFGGVGAEWLYRPWQSSVAFGVDFNEVKRRGYEQNFSFLNPEYKVATGHASIYWEGFQDINVTVRAGRYLAGDLGATLDLSRVFSNGVKFGAFATKTNVPSSVFGEGSFDKGIYVDIPFDSFLLRSSADVAHILYQPLIRDGGGILSRQFPLVNLTGKQSGKLLKWHPFDSNRQTQFGEVPDSYSDSQPDSVFAMAGNDLKDFGHAATTTDFWRSLMLIGGVSLGTALADKPLDKFAVNHGSGSKMQKVESLGNNLPFAVLGYSGLMFFTNDQNSQLGKTSYSALAAGGVGAVSALGLKYVVGRSRPSSEQGPGNFTPLSAKNSGTSWPSMHTTVMWAAVTPYAKEYDANWLYGVAAVTNVARVASRKHWFSDTVAGSMLGYAIGDFMWQSHKNKNSGPEWVVTPGAVTAYWKIK